MKMTRLEWRYLQRIALDHPYFDTHKLPLTEREAKAIVEANIRMTGKEFVDSIYAKLGMTRPQEEKKRFARLSSIGEQLAVPPIRKIAITVLVVLLMTVFFAATPVGRAIAESVMQYISSLLDDGRLFINRNDNETVMNPANPMPLSDNFEAQEQENSEVYINTFEEFAMATGAQPTILPLPYTELYYYHDQYTDYLKLSAFYETSKGTIITYQIWNTEVLSGSTSTGFTVYDSDPSIYYSVEENGAITVIKLYEDSIFTAYSEGSYSVDELIGLLMNE